MWRKLVLSEKDYEYLAKGIASGVGIGTTIGAIAGDVILFFSIGGVVGIIVATILSVLDRFKQKT